MDYCTETLIPWYRIIGWMGPPNMMTFKDIFLLILKLSFFSIKCFSYIPKPMFIKGKCLRRLAKKKKKKKNTLRQSGPKVLCFFFFFFFFLSAHSLLIRLSEYIR